MGLAMDAIRISGLDQARNWLRQAPDAYETAQQELRAAQMAEREVRDEYDQALLDAEWELDARFVSEGNKTFLVGHEWVVTNLDDGSGRTERREEPFKKSMTADERKAYKAAEARKLPAVAKSLAELRRAEERVASARDAVVAADKRLSATKLEVEAATATLNALVASMKSRELEAQVHTLNALVVGLEARQLAQKETNGQ